MPERDLVLGAAHAMEAEYLAPFVLSLKRTGYAGDIVFYASGLDARTNAWLERQGVTTITIDGDNPLLGIPVNSARYFVYKAFLEQQGGGYRHVMLSDVRDVVFQRNPFDEALTAPLCAYEESDGWTLATSPINCGWVAAAFGKEAIDRFGHHPILCSGTTLGTSDAIGAYVAEMARTLRELNTSIPCLLHVTGGIDQGVHNYLIRSGAIEGVVCVPNGQGHVWTLNYVDEDDLPVSADGTVLNLKAERAHVLHQYDRHTKLTQRLIAMLEGQSEAV